MRRPLLLHAAHALHAIRAARPAALALVLAAGALGASSAFGCSKSSSGPAASPYVPPAASAVVEPGVRREIAIVASKAPPPNPLTGDATPAEQNRLRVVRYRVDTAASSPVAARAIVIMMPGFLGGAGSFDPLARALVRRGKDDPAGPIEVWAIDRRSNLLEDTHGSDVAEVRQDTSWAERYYVEGETILLYIHKAGFFRTHTIVDGQLCFSDFNRNQPLTQWEPIIARFLSLGFVLLS